MPASKSRGISFAFRGPGSQVPATPKKGIVLWLSHSYCQTWAKTLTGTHEVSSLFCCHCKQNICDCTERGPGPEQRTQAKRCGIPPKETGDHYSK